jgi:hypothetical protein
MNERNCPVCGRENLHVSTELSKNIFKGTHVDYLLAYLKVSRCLCGYEDVYVQNLYLLTIEAVRKILLHPAPLSIWDARYILKLLGKENYFVECLISHPSDHFHLNQDRDIKFRKYVADIFFLDLIPASPEYSILRDFIIVNPEEDPVRILKKENAEWMNEVQNLVNRVNYLTDELAKK